MGPHGDSTKQLPDAPSLVGCDGRGPIPASEMVPGWLGFVCLCISESRPSCAPILRAAF